MESKKLIAWNGRIEAQQELVASLRQRQGEAKNAVRHAEAVARRAIKETEQAIAQLKKLKTRMMDESGRSGPVVKFRFGRYVILHILGGYGLYTLKMRKPGCMPTTLRISPADTLLRVGYYKTPDDSSKDLSRQDMAALAKLLKKLPPPPKNLSVDRHPLGLAREVADILERRFLRENTDQSVL